MAPSPLPPQDQTGATINMNIYIYTHTYCTGPCPRPASPAPPRWGQPLRSLGRGRRGKGTSTSGRGGLQGGEGWGHPGRSSHFLFKPCRIKRRRLLGNVIRLCLSLADALGGAGCPATLLLLMVSKKNTAQKGY